MSPAAEIPGDAPRSDDGQWWWDGEAWQPVAVAVVCAGCGATAWMKRDEASYTCPGCGSTFKLVACPDCSAISHAPPFATNAMRCSHCGCAARWGKWRKATASSADLAGQASIAPEHADADRRIVTGNLIAVTGFPPLRPSQQCVLDCYRDGVGVGTYSAENRLEYVAVVPYGDVGFLRVAGRGALTTTTGGGWVGGGVGLAGIAEGALFAAAANALTRRTRTTIETLIHFNAGSRELMMVNHEVTPNILQVRLAPVFARLETGKRQAPDGPLPDRGDALTRLERLGELKAKGLLTQEEFDAAKSQLLSQL